MLLTRVKRPSSLKDWAQAIARRSGAGKARVALARKLTVILHSIWRSGEPFRWSGNRRRLPNKIYQRSIQVCRGCDGCPTGRRCRRLRGRALGGGGKSEPAVDIAAPVLRTRCCGGYPPDRGENRDPDTAAEVSKRILTRETRLENAPFRARGNVRTVVARCRMLPSVRTLMRQRTTAGPV